MTTVAELLIDKRGMGAWLSSKEPESVVGYAGTCLNCPLARYVAEQVRSDEDDISTRVEATYDGIRVECTAGYQGIETPVWAGCFMATVDTAFADGLPIRAAAALAILNSVAV